MSYFVLNLINLFHYPAIFPTIQLVTACDCVYKSINTVICCLGSFHTFVSNPIHR